MPGDRLPRTLLDSQINDVDEQDDSGEGGAVGGMDVYRRDQAKLENLSDVLTAMDDLVNNAEEPSDGVKVKTVTDKVMIKKMLPKKLFDQPKENPLKKLTKIISIQSLLVQFSHPSVRADFINGRFGEPSINTSLLERIDELRWTLMPRWIGGEIAELQRSASAAYHFDEMMNGSEAPFITNVNQIERCMTYREWMDTLEILALDSYWSETSVEERCTHVLTSKKSKEENVQNSQYKKNSKVKIINSKAESSSQILKKLKKMEKKTVEQVTISSSSESSSSSSCSSDSEEDNWSKEVKNVRGQRVSRHRYYDKRDVVTPPKFQVGGTQSLKEFLNSYEQYFDSKYKGSTFDKTQKLSEFLTDELLEVFNIRGGRKLQYEDMKRHLLEYYKKQKIGGKSYWRKKLSDSTPSPSESLELYGLKLVEIAEQGYSRDKKECASQLRNQFLKTIPTEIANKIQEVECTLKATGTTKHRHLTFEKLSQLAKELQDKQKPKSVMFARSEREVVPEQKFRSKMPENEYRSRNFGPTSRSRSQSSNSHQKQSCSYCKNVNHKMEDCWKANKKCLICGSDHEMNLCPRYNPDYRREKSNSDLN